MCYIDYILEQTKRILEIDSPSGYTGEVAEYVMGEYHKLGYNPIQTVKGGIIVDLGCVGEGLTCTEHQVSICAKDSKGPYNYEVVTNLIKAAQEAKLNFAVDVYPHYGSDADVTLTAGNDVKHGLIGPGVYASHGYERSHKEGVYNTFELLRKYLG